MTYGDCYCGVFCLILYKNYKKIILVEYVIFKHTSQSVLIVEGYYYCNINCKWIVLLSDYTMMIIL